MAYSPFDILMDLDDDPGNSDDGEERSSTLDDLNNNNYDNHDSITNDCDPNNSNNNEQASLEIMSLNSETLQDFGSMVSLPPGTLTELLFRSSMDESGEDESDEITEEEQATIVSSAPSGATIPPPPEASCDIYAISPHPQMLISENCSISTVSTEYTRVLDTLDDDDGDNINNSSSSPQQALVPFSSGVNVGGGVEEETNRHGRVSYMAVANHLLQDDSSTSTNSSRTKHWFERMKSQHDWDQFRQVAEMILQCIDPSPPTNVRLLPLPPSVPQDLLPSGLIMGPEMIGAANNSPCFEAKDLLPEQFVCTICNDVIVGALTLDCGCALSTVCTSCWESKDANQNPHDLSDQLGFVWVEEPILPRQNNQCCPSCCRQVSSTIPSNALDVAILHFVQTVDNSGSDARVCHLQHSYCNRLEAWRCSVEVLNEAAYQRTQSRRDALLAQMIEQEEAVFWQDQENVLATSRRRKEQEMARARNILFFGQTAIALIAATLTSAGLSAIATNRR